MLKFKSLIVAIVALSAIMFTGCQNEPTAVEQDSGSNQLGLSKFTLPAGAEFVSATFNVDVSTGFSNGQPIFVHRITTDWLEMDVTWTSFYSTSPPLPYNETAEGDFPALVGLQSLDVTDLVGSWLDGTNPNYGLLLDQHTFVAGVNKYHTIGFHPSYLEITYLDEDDNTKIEITEAFGDTFIHSDEANVNTNYGGAFWMETGWTAEKQALVKFDLEVTPPELECETAYAKGPNAICFLDISPKRGNNWGWTNKITGPGAWNFPIYAGAGQCDVSKGALVGTLDVTYDGAIVTVFYNIDSDYSLDETHLWVGSDMLPMKRGKYVSNPGGFNYNGQNPVSVDIVAPFYIAAHSVVCGEFE